MKFADKRNRVVEFEFDGIWAYREDELDGERDAVDHFMFTVFTVEERLSQLLHVTNEEGLVL